MDCYKVSFFFFFFSNTSKWRLPLFINPTPAKWVSWTCLFQLLGSNNSSLCLVYLRKKSSWKHKGIVNIKISAVTALLVLYNYFISKPYLFLNTLFHSLPSCNGLTGDQSTEKRIFSHLKSMCNSWRITLYNTLVLLPKIGARFFFPYLENIFRN